jgi:uncharacterized protein YfaS (alpha-2-macroglobulin family)
LPSGEQIVVGFNLGKLMEVPSEYKVMEFGFVVIKQSLFVSFDGIRIKENNFLKHEIFGVLRTSDYAEKEKIEKCLKASQEGAELDISLQQVDESKNYTYVIKGITRKEKESKVLIQWDGEAIGSDTNDEIEVEIPAINEFKLMQIQTVQTPGLYFSLQFSDPVDPDQDLEGLISLRSGKKLRFSIAHNEVKAYPISKPGSSEIIVVNNTIQSTKGQLLPEDVQKKLVFNLQKPAVGLVGEGVIMPTDGNVRFPFKAINLKAVNMRILRIYEHNIHQFFQTNQFNGSSELSRVGRLVYDDVIDLVSTEPLDYGVWNTFNIDLSNIIDPEPGAIYRVMVSFEQYQSLYPCADSTAQIKPMKRRELNFDENAYFNDELWYEGYYEYHDRDNPCSPSYYKYYNRSISANVFASNFGIMAKESANDNYTVVITDLRTTLPLSGIQVEAYNFQHSKIGEGKTNKDGTTRIKTDGKPYLIVAKDGKQRGYLRVDQGSSLSVSLYNVEGVKIKKGIKGFIYGERGVWRPGDTLFLSFMLEDKLNALPESHPVVMELYDPRGKLFDKKVKTNGVKGLYGFRFKTEAKSPTGRWVVKAKVGNSEFSKVLKIETIKPNRLKIDYDFDEFISSSDDISAVLQTKWLYGAPGANLKATVEMNVSAIKTEFESYEGFAFDDRSVRFGYQDPLFIETQTNKEGEAVIRFKWDKPKQAPGMLKCSFNTKVYEQGGDFSQDFLSKKYSPFISYVGIKMEKGQNWLTALDTEEEHKVAIAAVDEYGKPLSKKVTVELYKIDWNWWWEAEGEDEITRYINRRTRNRIKSETFVVKEGKGFYKLSFPNSGWGKYLIRVIDHHSGHSASQTFFGRYSSWYNDNAGGDNDAASALNIETGKDAYNVGEPIEVTVPSGGVGNIYVTIEKGDEIIDQMWIDAASKSTTFNFDATEEMAPNIYVHAVLIQPHGQEENSLPIRMYGVTPIKVYDANTHLEPVIQSPNILQPEKTFSIKVSEKSGQSMAYTVALVDEGLLSLTRFKTPNPWSLFYAKEALTIRTWDMYKYVMSAQTGKMSPLMAIGGDEGLEYKEDVEANRFKPVVSYLGPFFLGKGDKNTHQIHIPNYIGAVRAMVVAGYNGAYGFAEKEMEVKQPLMVLSTLPRVLGPSEKIVIPVNVISMDDAIKSVEVKVSSNELLKPIGARKKSIQFEKSGEKTIYFEYEVARSLGVGTFKVEVKSGSHKAYDEVELEVRAPNPEITTSNNYPLEGHTIWQKEYEANGIKGSNSAKLQISSIPDLNLEKHLKYLIRYPHGCIEQTTSSAFPQLFLNSFIRLSAEQKDEVQENVIAGLNRLKSFQMVSGAFSYWPGADYPSEWGTNYAGHFMIEAKNKGYKLPVGLLDSWVKFQRSAAANWERAKYYGYGRYGGDLTQAYRLYTLALSGNGDIGAMNRLRSDTKISDAAAWRLAAAYAVLGRKDVAAQLANRTTTVDPYRSMSYSFGSDVRDMAMILETMHYLENRSKAFSLMDDISKRLKQGWHSTQTRAYALLAIAKYISSSSSDVQLSTRVEVNGKTMVVDSESPVWSIDIEDAYLKKGQLKIENLSDNLVFISFTQSGIPVEVEHAPEERDMHMEVAYTDLNGNKLDVSSLPQGQDFKAIIHVKHPGIRNEYKEVALNQVFPSGWQIVNTRVGDDSGNEKTSSYTYRDIRDDRVYTYFNLNRGEAKTFEVLLNATFEGKFYMPAVFCAPMYDESIQSIKPGRWVEVVKK